MEQITRLNISAALNNVRAFSGTGIERIKNIYSPDDLREYMAAIGNETLFGEFELDSDNRYIYENIRKWADGNKDFEALDPETYQYTKGDISKGIYLAGPTGTGKTVLLSIIKKYVDGIFLKMSVDGKDEKFSWRQYRSDEICMDYSRDGDINKYVNQRILCIDDIGSEPKETLYMGNRVEVIRMILERRGDWCSRCITLLTSNYPIDALPYGPRVTSRLHQMCNYYELKGKDRRYGK